MKNSFDKEVMLELTQRIESLTSQSKPLWGKMNVAQMLAHCAVPYQYAYEPEKFKKPSLLKKFFIKLLVKNYVINTKPYPKNATTSPEFIIADERDFEAEKSKLLSYLRQTQDLGAAYFEGRENLNFGTLSAQEWNTMYYRHLDHHLSQFGV